MYGTGNNTPPSIIDGVGGIGMSYPAPGGIFRGTSPLLTMGSRAVRRGSRELVARIAEPRSRAQRHCARGIVMNLIEARRQDLTRRQSRRRRSTTRSSPLRPCCRGGLSRRSSAPSEARNELIRELDKLAVVGRSLKRGQHPAVLKNRV